MKKIVLSTLLLLVFSSVFAQNTIQDNKLDWWHYFGTFKIAKQFSIHSEYQ
jgi:hypothetical protein